MKKSLLFFASLAFVSLSWGQAQVENPGFEEIWEDVLGTEDEPLEWSSLKTADALTSFAPIVAFKETNNPHTGTYCIRLKVVNSFGVNAAGVLTNGRVHADFNPELGYVYTDVNDTIWNYAFTDRPDSLVFWVKHAPVSGDQSKVEVILHDNTQTGQLPHTGVTTHWVGRARHEVVNAYSTWTRISTPFNYYNTNTPDYLLITLSAGDSTIAVEDTEMWVDDIELIYNPLTVSIDPPAVQNIDISTNGTMLTVTETANAGVTGTISREWKYATTSGGPYSSFSPVETGTTYTPNFASPDIYYVICETDFDGQVVQSNEVEIVVTDPNANSVTITPSANQTILTDQDGNTLTANENPTTATSREWKFSTTSGSGYASFTTAETGTTYTPNFSNLGTYYVICESDFSGDIQISNEVTIYVPSSAGINEENLKFNIYVSGQQLNVEYQSEVYPAQFYLYDLSGKLIYKSVIEGENTQHPLPDQDGIYLYQLLNGDHIISGKVKL